MIYSSKPIFLSLITHSSIHICFIVFFSLEDISPPEGVKKAMEMQAEAKRKKRAKILELEGNGLYFVELTL